MEALFAVKSSFSIPLALKTQYNATHNNIKSSCVSVNLKNASEPMLNCNTLKSSIFNSANQSSFWNGGDSIVALTLTSTSNVRRISGGALNAEMNLFQRLGRIVSSYANAAISAAEDPEKILEQAVLEMNDDLVKMRQATAQVLASQKQIENRYKQSAQTSDDWYRRAKLALEKGDEELAKEALKRKKDYDESAKSLKQQLDQQVTVVENLVANTRVLEGKISEARAKKDTLKARAQSAKTTQKVNELVGNIGTSSALAAFEKMEEKVIALEAESEAVSQISGDALTSKFALLEGDAVDDDLAELKRELRGGSSLPAGRYATGGRMSAMSEKELEVEAELNELRRRAREL